MRAKTLFLCALFAAAIVHVTPVGAFDLENNVSRSVTGHIVTDANAFMAVSSQTACTASPTVGVCSPLFTITNRATTDVKFRIMKETDTGGTKLTNYGIGSVASVASGWTAQTGSINAGSAITVLGNVSTCLALCTTKYYANFTVEAQKANVLDVNQTRLMIMYQDS